MFRPSPFFGSAKNSNGLNRLKSIFCIVSQVLAGDIFRLLLYIDYDIPLVSSHLTSFAIFDYCTQVIGLTNDDEVSKEFRPYKQMIERLNRTYKASYRPTNGFDNIDGANYELALWVTYYNFLRPHKHNNYKVLNDVEMLHGADNMPGKWQLLIFLGQQTILNLQNSEAANCS